MKGEDEARRAAIVRTTLEAIYAFSHFLAPVIPHAAQGIFRRLNSAPVSSRHLRADLYNLRPGTPVQIGDILFQKIESSSSAAAGPASTNAKEPRGLKGPPAAKNGDDAVHEHDFSKADIRVGVVTRIWKHASSERLFCAEIDVGDPAGTAPRQVASGLRPHYCEEQLLGRKVLVVCNLKEAKFQGFLSQGMVLAASLGDRLELLDPPADSRVGQRVFAAATDPATTSADYSQQTQQPLPFSAAKMKKLKVWEAVAAGLRTDGACFACWASTPAPAGGGGEKEEREEGVGAPLLRLVVGGPCTAASLAHAKVT